jgi:LCP family protein required for cell wall assembly
LSPLPPEPEPSPERDPAAPEPSEPPTGERFAAAAGLPEGQEGPPGAPPPAEPSPPPAGPGPPAAPPSPPAPPKLAAAGGEPPRRPRLWLRFLAASALIVLSTAAATSISALDYIGGIASALGHDGRLSKVDRFLARGYEGGPQTILVIGSNYRPNGSTGKNGLSDTVMLIRLNPVQGTINMLSIPRELKVNIPGYGIGKINAAYSYGGPELTLRTLADVTGLAVNHVFVVGFEGFARAVDAIGCVYVDVDQHYFHTNEGVAPSEEYSEIDIEPGYQELCGKKALQFVRYRHTDNDIVRGARQQDFLRDVRQMIPTEQLIEQRNLLINIFTRYTTSDLHSTEQLLELLKLFIELRGDPIKQIPFPAVLEPLIEGQPNYVTASPSSIHHVVSQFLGAGPGPAKSASTARGKGKAKARSAKPPAKPGSAGLTDAAGLGAQMASRAQSALRFPVFYPRKLPAEASYAEAPRTYGLRDPSGKRHSAYKMVIEVPAGSYVAYFGVQGIEGWSDPPILNGESEAVKIGGRAFQAFTNAGQIRLLAWHEGPDTYWIDNSLAGALSNAQMLGVARSIAALRPRG